MGEFKKKKGEKIMRKFNAFTLAEVLITLGIIGVVAAMTMPTLINQTNGAQYKAAYKKALSAIAQGITLNVALDDKSFADATVESDDSAPANSVAGFLKSRMNVVNLTDDAGYTLPTLTVSSETVQCSEAEMNDENTSECNGTNTTKTVSVTVNPDLFMFFNDGSMFGFLADDTECKAGDSCYAMIDVNGQKGPNKLVEDANKPTDIYIVEYFDQTIRPVTEAGSGVLYGK